MIIHPQYHYKPRTKPFPVATTLSIVWVATLIAGLSYAGYQYIKESRSYDTKGDKFKLVSMMDAPEFDFGALLPPPVHGKGK